MTGGVDQVSGRVAIGGDRNFGYRVLESDGLSPFVGEIAQEQAGGNRLNAQRRRQ